MHITKEVVRRSQAPTLCTRYPYCKVNPLFNNVRNDNLHKNETPLLSNINNNGKKRRSFDRRHKEETSIF